VEELVVKEEVDGEVEVLKSGLEKAEV